MIINHSLDSYKVFYEVAISGSISGAATKLAITQPAVSQSIKQLEEALDTKLFIRASKGVKLTPEGELLYNHVEKAFEQIALGEDKINKMKNMELGEIRIGASDMTLQYFLLSYLETFHEKYPNIKVSVTNGPTPETLANLEEGKIDFGLVSTPFEIKDTVNVLPVREVEDVFVAGRRFIQYKNKMLDMTQLSEIPLIMLEKNTSTRKYMDNILLENEVTVSPEFELATSEMIVQFAVRNLGVGCVVKDFAREYIDNGTLYELRFNKMIPKRKFCLVTNKKSQLTKAAEKLFDIINEAL